MRNPETAEQIRKRERRMARRESSIVMVGKRRERKNSDIERKNRSSSVAIEILKSDNRTSRIKDKKPGGEKFLQAFSYIPWTPFDKRGSLPPDYRCRSFNEKRQYLEFMREFIYPYQIPALLLWAGLEKETLQDEKGRVKPSPDIEIIRLAKKWICDIVSGGSFYKKNREYFTHAESHFFLNTPAPYKGASSVVELHFFAKFRARNIGEKQSTALAGIFTLKFSKNFRRPVVTGFMDLIARGLEQCPSNSELGDICDFINAKIEEDAQKSRKKPRFSLSGRTMASISVLANEWHAAIQREQEFQNNLHAERRRLNMRLYTQRDPPNPALPVKWDGISASVSRFEDEGRCWIVTQLHTARELLNEGRKMKNCVASYTSYCASGEGSIFNVSCTYYGDQITESKATLQVTRNRQLVQAKAKCNLKVSPATMHIIRKWAQSNHIKIVLV